MKALSDWLWECRASPSREVAFTAKMVMKWLGQLYEVHAPGDDIKHELDWLGVVPRQPIHTNGDKGKITMPKVKKEDLHPISQIFKSDGTLNVPALTFGLAHAMGQDAAGHISITHGSAHEHANADGSVDVTIKFKRNHH